MVESALPRNSKRDTGFSAALLALVVEHDAQVTSLQQEIDELRAARKNNGPRLFPPTTSLAGLAVKSEHDIDTLDFKSHLWDPPANIGSEPSLNSSDKHSSTKESRKTLKLLQDVVYTPQRLSVGNLKTGFWENLRLNAGAQLEALETVIGAIILLNTILLGVSSDLMPTWFGWVIIDALFALIFLMEMLFKLRVLGCRKYFWGPEFIGNAVEAVLVVFAVMESVMAFMQEFMKGESGDGTQLMSLFRIVRLCRVVRVIRVMRLECFAELKTMIRGTVGGMRTLLWSAVLMTLPVYAICLVFRETLGSLNEADSGSEYFESVPLAFFSVFRCIVVGECADLQGRPLFVVATDKHGWIYGFMFAFFSTFMSFGLFNVIGAMFVENVVETCKARDKTNRKERLRDPVYFAQKMAELLEVVLKVCSCESEEEMRRCVSEALPGAVSRTSRSKGETTVDEHDIFARAAGVSITPERFTFLRELDCVQRLLDQLDVADDDQHNLFDALDANNSGDIDLEELCAGIWKLRGDPCRSDIISVGFRIQNIQNTLSSEMDVFAQRLNLLEQKCEQKT